MGIKTGSCCWHSAPIVENRIIICVCVCGCAGCVQPDISSVLVRVYTQCELRMLPPLSYVECCMLCVCARVLISSTPRQSPFKRATRTHACMHLRTVSHLSYAIGSHTAQPKSTHTWADWPPLQQHQQQQSNSFSLLLEYVIALVCVFCWTHTKAIMQYIYLFVCTFIRAETNTLQTP